MSKKYNIAVIPGDGIGPEITTAAVEVLEAAASRQGIDIFIKMSNLRSDLKRRFSD